MTHKDSSADRTCRYRAGEVLADKYRLERVLGEGGQACVWRAQNLVLDVGVAIKFVTNTGENGADAARLLIEARTAAKLRHPGIVRVFDFGHTEAGDSFLVLELLEGESLARRLATRGRLAPEQAVALMLPIAEALGAAHAAGVLHRDIKPANIFLASNEGRLEPKLLDFGIAKVESATSLPSELTRAGAIVGSPAYLSPEQARGEPDPDHRVDVWSFAVSLYETITGELPFPEDTYNALLWAIVENEPRSLADHGVGDGELWAIVRRGLAKSRVERWGSMDEFGRALAGWLVARGILEDATGTRLSTRWLTEPSASVTKRSEPDLEHAPHRRSVRGTEITARLHPPLSRSLVASGSSALRQRARIGALSAVAGCALASALYWLEPRLAAVRAELGPAPAPTAELVEQRAATGARLSAAGLVANAEPWLATAANVPIVAPAPAPVLVQTKERAVAPNAAAPNAAAPTKVAPAAPVAVLAPRKRPQPSLPLRLDPGAELLNPY